MSNDEYDENTGRGYDGDGGVAGEARDASRDDVKGGWTRGPWTFWNESHAPRVLANGDEVAKANPERNYFEAQANARLIAAAPELFEALVELLACNEEFQSLFPNRAEDEPGKAPVEVIAANITREIRAEEQARAAIAKATGGTSTP